MGILNVFQINLSFLRLQLSGILNKIVSYNKEIWYENRVTVFAKNNHVGNEQIDYFPGKL